MRMEEGSKGGGMREEGGGRGSRDEGGRDGGGEWRRGGPSRRDEER